MADVMALKKFILKKTFALDEAVSQLKKYLQL